MYRFRRSATIATGIEAWTEPPSSESLDAATAGRRVGYESPSRFSREYRRLFGVTPGKDVQQRRA